MKSQNFFRILIFLSCFVLATPSEAQVGKLLKGAFTKIQSRWEHLILREAASSVPATKAIAPFIFTPGQSLPVLPGNSFVSRYPLAGLPTEMYHGMRLDAKGAQLRNILRNGLEVDKTRSFLREAYNGKTYPPDAKAIFASTWLEEAITFANYGFDDELPVLFHLKRVGNSSLIQVPHNIPLSWIYRVSVCLQIDGEPRWGEMKLDENNNLLFIPYPPPQNNP